MSATACFSLQATSETSGLYQGPLAADRLRQAPTSFPRIDCYPPRGVLGPSVSLIHLAFDSLRPLDGTTCSSLQVTSESFGSSQNPLATPGIFFCIAPGSRFLPLELSRLTTPQPLRRPHNTTPIAFEPMLPDCVLKSARYLCLLRFETAPPHLSKSSLRTVPIVAAEVCILCGVPTAVKHMVFGLQ